MRRGPVPRGNAGVAFTLLIGGVAPMGVQAQTTVPPPRPPAAAAAADTTVVTAAPNDAQDRSAQAGTNVRVAVAACVAKTPLAVALI
ncbi:hypothetical protein [Gemmatimonas phototrophica]|uniref:Uncharacterized protein n=1 Tax=Gemmatimonas phototrophica TaxID=1379270 RepID=A0A143BG84_9BACT|nr:hypothetical protein [Gemmatimonas phototrophica]AMW04049.1 hypothetical protein GEMMAAP_02735 [Gemmatimonas phototrophica]